MKTALRFLPIVLFFLAGIVLVAWFISTRDIAILNPQGPIAAQQRTLIIVAISLMLVVAIPMLLATAWIAWRYRASNTRATYTPEAGSRSGIELAGWGIIGAVILILSVVNWQSTHALDPYRPLESEKEPITIQVIGLRWKWLFLYPEQGIATVNEVVFPENTPVAFQLTADAPMNSFWIPHLGGQMYLMEGMVTKLHLMADGVGEYPGSTPEISGAGFAGMRFTAKSVTDEDFDRWVHMARLSPQTLDLQTYAKLAEPSERHPVTYYATTQAGLYNEVVTKFLTPPLWETEHGTHQPVPAEHQSHHGAHET